MSDPLPIIAIVACLAVLLVLVFGLTSFARGGEFNRRWSNKIMRLRVALQLFAVIVIVAIAWAFGG